MAKELVVYNPMDNSVVGTCELLNTEEVIELVDTAAAAQPAWEAVPLSRRAEILVKLAQITLDNKHRTGEILTKEQGKPIPEAMAESEEAAFMLRANAERAQHLYTDVLPENHPGHEDDVIFTKREAAGVVACIIPFNYPVALAFQKISAALIMGNTCVVKVPSLTPLSLLAFRDYVKQAGLPDGVLQFFASDRTAITKAICENPKVQVITMTGSTKAGVEIAKAAASTLKTMLLELGGNDPLIIFDDVDPKKAAVEISNGRLWCNGQVCCGTKRVLVQRSIKDQVVEELKKIVTGWKAGDPMQEDTIVSCLVSEQAAITVEQQVNATIAAGAKLVCGGVREGARYYPTILDDVTPEMDIAKDMEVFAMVFPIIAFDTEEEALRIANQTSYGLSSGVMSADTNRAFRVGKGLKAGTAVVNGSGCYKHFEQPFGGPKMTGLGREGVSSVMEEMSVLKTYVLKGAFAK